MAHQLPKLSALSQRKVFTNEMGHPVLESCCFCSDSAGGGIMKDEGSASGERERLAKQERGKRGPLIILSTSSSPQDIYTHSSVCGLLWGLIKWVHPPCYPRLGYDIFQVVQPVEYLAWEFNRDVGLPAYCLRLGPWPSWNSILYSWSKSRLHSSQTRSASGCLTSRYFLICSIMKLKDN